MSNESSTISYLSAKKRSIDRSRYSDQFIFSDIKQRKFRWSSCFAFVSKLKKSKSIAEPEQQIRLAQSHENINPVHRLDTIVKVKSEEFNPSLWPTQPLPLPQPQLQSLSSSLSPPPRQTKSKRESMREEDFIEPKPRVTPRAIKTSSSLLRLSLDVEALSSPESLLEHPESHRFSTTSVTSQSPFRTGTLGSCSSQTNSSVVSQHSPQFTFSSSSIPPPPPPPPPPSLPLHIPLIKEQDKKKMALKDRRRHRHSPLLAPNTDQLTLALRDVHLKEESKARSQVVSLQPIAPVQVLDRHFSTEQVVSREKAQYDAIVSRTASQHRRQLSHEDHHQERPLQSTTYRTSLRARSPSFSESAQKEDDEDEQQRLDRICEDQPLKTTHPSTKSSSFLINSHRHLTVTPETPPYHQPMTPSFISVPSTPNSMDSFKDDYLVTKPTFS